MSKWKQLEEMICRGTQGKRTPGSGNGRLKGDIIAVDLEGLIWGIEAKDSQQNSFTLAMEWFEELVRDCGEQYELALVIRWGKVSRVYVYDSVPGVLPDGWRTRCVRDMDELPATVFTANGKWTLTHLDDFFTLFP